MANIDLTVNVPTERFLVTMTSAFALPDGGIATHKATDFVAAPDLNEYVADARTRWQVVVVAEKATHITGAYDEASIVLTEEV